MAIIIFVLVLWYGGLFFQSFFLHRYAAHQVFTMSKTMERITFILTWVFQGSSYLSAYGYGIMHRMHHAYTDTEKDPHSPSHDANLFAMMWKTKQSIRILINSVLKLINVLPRMFHNGKNLTYLQARGFLVYFGFLLTSYSLHSLQQPGGNGYYYLLPFWWLQYMVWLLTGLVISMAM